MVTGYIDHLILLLLIHSNLPYPFSLPLLLNSPISSPLPFHSHLLPSTLPPLTTSSFPLSSPPRPHLLTPFSLYQTCGGCHQTAGRERFAAQLATVVPAPPHVQVLTGVYSAAYAGTKYSLVTCCVDNDILRCNAYTQDACTCVSDGWFQTFVYYWLDIYRISFLLPLPSPLPSPSLLPFPSLLQHNNKSVVDVRPCLPLLNDVLYESPFASQLWMLFDSSKQFLLAGDAYQKQVCRCVCVY